MQHIVIIGAGQAGAQTLISLRQGGFDGTISLIGDEPALPYQRPPLSKKFLAGEMEKAQLFFRPQAFYDKENIALYLGQRAEKIDPAAKIVTLTDGTELTYTQLMLSLGSRPRTLPIADTDYQNLFDIRTIADIEAIRPHFTAGKKLVIIGGGYIGLETAAVAQQMGLDTIIIEAAERILARVASPQIADFYERIHNEKGVQIITNMQVTEFATQNNGKNENENKISELRLSNGRTLAADLVVAGIGIVPNVELAEKAGLKIDNGIVVDEFARTSITDIYAGGDCTQHPNALLGRRLRLESVQNAIAQGKTAAAHILGEAKAYAEIPWFWSDQYDIKLQMAGLAIDYDRIILRGDDNTNSFALFYFNKTQLIAADAINRPAEFMAAKKLIHVAAEKNIQIDPAQLGDETSAPKDWVRTYR
ncbi:MAG: FAD-dependent oxidoreductase [Alphaproteobacteria bacterium]|nr:FAD-dependent oxidoreductase [Alphaproteobacteria bacterium]